MAWLRLSALLLCSSLVISVAAQESAGSKSQLQELLATLDADDFQDRKAAAAQLAELPAEDLRQLLQIPHQSLSAEVVVRLLTELESRYQSNSDRDVKTASEILESLADSPRLMLADGVQTILSRHWRTRVTLARQELETLGARFRDGTFSSRRNVRWLPGREMPTLQILIGEEWRGGTEGLRIIERMSALTDSSLQLTGLYVWVLEGHKLGEDDFNVLNDLIGRTRIYERSRVALGISGSPIVGEGVLIETITKGGSAADAGLLPGDLILEIVEPIPDELSEEEKRLRKEAQKLRDFDDLVERLKKYREGDVMRLRIIRGIGAANQFGQFQNPPLQIRPVEKIVDVKLKGWDKLSVRQE